MRNLRKLRVLATVVCFTAAVLYAVLRFREHGVFALEEKAQIVPSLIVLPVTLGATLFWIAVTIILGRVYCSTVCPIGAIQDGVIWVCKAAGLGKREFRYKKPSRLRLHFLIIYSICLVFSVGVVTSLMEPWPMFQGISGLAHPGESVDVWHELGYGIAGGIAAGVVSLVAVVVWSALGGRDFCNVYCPVGTVLGLVSEKALWQIRFDPDKCISCMKCEEVCKASCIKVAERRVDNMRCIRCFDCIDVCPNSAIRYQKEQNRAATPMMKKA